MQNQPQTTDTNRRMKYTRIKHLIEQTCEAFENYGSMNTDYADFATIALSDFKSLLGTPDLTDRELKQLIRKAALRHRNQGVDTCWASFMARSIAKKSNQNLNA